jgi:hypothetical protein
MKFERPDRTCFRGPWPKAGIGIHAHDTDWMEQITSKQGFKSFKED